MNVKADSLKTIMKENKYTYEYLANALGYSKVFVWQIIHGERRLTYENALLIARIFNTKPDKLFYSDFINNANINEKLEKIDKYISQRGDD